MSDKLNHSDNTEMSVKIARAVAERGGSSYYVGGFVRDLLMYGENRSFKDVDIEVHGISPETLREVLSTLGEVKTMGVSFGVFNLRGYDIDIAMPRTEHATGRGHKDFEVYVDPFIGPENAARRRDFTVNAFMMNVLTGEMLDFFGGREDLENKILRHVDNDSFTEDPLRVFRAAQFAARFGFTVAPETVRLCSSMDVSALSAERVFGETEKAFLKSRCPGTYFAWLRKTDRLSFWFPEIDEWYSRTGAGPDAGKTAAQKKMDGILTKAARAASKSTDPFGFTGAALTVLLEGEGGRADWLRRITKDRRLIKYCENTAITAVSLNAACSMSSDRIMTEKKLLKIINAAVAPEDSLRLAELIYGKLLTARGAFELYKERMKLPAVTGQELMERGIRPGPRLGEAVEYASELRLFGIGKDEALEETVAIFRDGE